MGIPEEAELLRGRQWAGLNSDSFVGVFLFGWWWLLSSSALVPREVLVLSSGELRAPGTVPKVKYRGLLN